MKKTINWYCLVLTIFQKLSKQLQLQLTLLIAQITNTFLIFLYYKSVLQRQSLELYITRHFTGL